MAKKITEAWDALSREDRESYEEKATALKVSSNEGDLLQTFRLQHYHGRRPPRNSFNWSKPSAGSKYQTTSVRLGAVALCKPDSEADCQMDTAPDTSDANASSENDATEQEPTVVSNTDVSATQKVRM